MRLWLMLLRTTRYHLLRFRLETFGLYYPSLPHARPWWRVTPSATTWLLRRLGRYRRWLAEMEDVARGDGPRWWASRLDTAARARWVRALAELNGGESLPAPAGSKRGETL